MVTNRRVIFSGEDRNDIRDWSLDAISTEADESADVIDLTDDVELDLTDA